MTTMFATIAENPKLATAEALRQAMLSTMDDGTNSEWANPTSWAPFVLVGEAGVCGDEQMNGRNFQYDIEFNREVSSRRTTDVLHDLCSRFLHRRGFLGSLHSLRKLR